VGGGWYGNIGILFTDGLSDADIICVGDPVSSDAWAAPAIAARRSYRGMLYKPDASSSISIADDDGNAIRVQPDGTGKLPGFVSHGIAGGAQLPAPGEPGHDFVIGSLPQNMSDGSHCTTQGIMLRDDATIDGVAGSLFAGMPAGFVCLNDGHLDDYDERVYAHRSDCPYDPSEPPTARHVISGSLRLAASDASANTGDLPIVRLRTSDAPGNCMTALPVRASIYYQYDYQCDVYHAGNGWSGYVEPQYDTSQMECGPARILFSDVTTNSNNNDFENCTMEVGDED
jgi:hypothetical protein